MNSLDITILIPIAIGLIIGLFKGFIKELTSLLAIFLGIYGAKIFSPVLAQLLIARFDFSTKTAQPLAFFMLFIGIAIVLLLISNLLDKLFESISLGWLNKLLGGLFGAAKYALVVSVLLHVFNLLDVNFKLIDEKTKAESIAYKPVLNFAPTLWDEAKSSLENSSSQTK